jgi:hypothetical protein
MATVWGQATFPFQMTLTQGNNTTNIGNGTTIYFATAGPGQTSTATVVLTYVGSNTAIFNTMPQVLGGNAQDFTLYAPDTYPKVLPPMGKVSFIVQYSASSPVGASPATAQINLPFVDTAQNNTGVVALALSGTTPNFSVFYTNPSIGNATPLFSGGIVLFPDTMVNATSAVTISVTNVGSGSGSISAISVNGAAFQALGLPSFPLSVPAGSSLQFLIRFAPQQAGASAGTLQMTLGGDAFTAALQGSAVVSSFSYQVIQSTASQPVLPGQTISLPDTKVSSTSSVDVQVTNGGTAAGVINSIVISGTGFSVTDGPVLPVTLNPNQKLVITVAFTPQQPGTATGRLRFNNDIFNLASNGIGPQLVYSYTAANSAPVTIVPGGAVVFTQTSVGNSSIVKFAVQNTGTAEGSIISIGTALSTTSTQSPAVFTAAGVPALPATLNAGATLTFSLVFAPDNTVLETSNLLIDTAVFTLSGLGGSPTPLPPYGFSGPQGTQPPFQQPAVSLSLASPYSLPLKGTVTLTQDSGSLAPDPAVQFATGGTTVAFVMPANSTDAVFPNGTKQIRLQTGSVATSVTLTPSFATQPGLDLTPATPQTLQFSVAPAAPQLLTAGISSLASNTFTLTVTGYTTTRSLTNFQFQLTASSSVTLSASQLILDVSGASHVWFQSSASQQFGGQFVVSIPFNLQVSSGTVATPTNELQSISVTAVNGSGTSNTVTVTP